MIAHAEHDAVVDELRGLIGGEPRAVLRDTYYRGTPAVADAEHDAVEDELGG